MFKHNAPQVTLHSQTIDSVIQTYYVPDTVCQAPAITQGERQSPHLELILKWGETDKKSQQGQTVLVP